MHAPMIVCTYYVHTAYYIIIITRICLQTTFDTDSSPFIIFTDFQLGIYRDCSSVLSDLIHREMLISLRQIN